MQFGSVLWAALGIGLLIFIHELGHFLAARLAGVRVEVFSLGFGPRLCGVVWKGTDFRLSLVPFGGFVMVAGQDPSDDRHPRSESLYSKSVGQRALFWSGGVLMNSLFALAVFPLAFGAGVPFTAPVIGAVQPGGAAWEAGLQAGDRVLSIEGKPVYAFETLFNEVVLHGQRPVRLEVKTGDEAARTVTVTPHFDAEDRLYAIGVVAGVKPAVLQVEAGGPAAAAGLRTGDVLQTVDGIAAHGATLAAAIQPLETPTAAPIRLQVLREGQVVEATIEPKAAAQAAPGRIGVQQVARRIAGVRSGSRIVQALGLRRGDVILSIDGAPFVGGDLAVALQGPDRLRLLVLRDGREVNCDQPASPADRAELGNHVALETDGVVMLKPLPGGPAERAGLQPGDRLESVGGELITELAALRKHVEAATDQPLVLRVRRLTKAPASYYDPERRELPLGDLVELSVPVERLPAWTLGLDARFPRQEEVVRAGSIGEALKLGTVCSFDLVKQFVVTLKRLVTGDVGAKNLGGIIRISQVSYDAAQRGTSWFWYFLALLSVNLAFVNLLPVPVLDGGHLLFLFIERIKGSPVSTRVLGYSQVVGLVFVLLLVLFVTYNDILRLF